MHALQSLHMPCSAQASWDRPEVCLTSKLACSWQAVHDASLSTAGPDVSTFVRSTPIHYYPQHLPHKPYSKSL